MASKTFSKEYSINGTKHWSLDLIITEVLSNEANRIAENKTPLHYELWLRDVASSYTFSKYKIGRSVSINGTTVYNVARENSAYLSLGNNASLKLAEGDTTVAHSADGTKTISVSFSIDMTKASYTPGPLSGSGSMTLTTIARASQPTLSSTNFNMGSNVTIYMNRKSDDFTHTVECFNDSDTKLLPIGTAKKVGNSISWDTRTLFPHCKYQRIISGYIKVTTYNGSNVIGAAKVVNFKATVPNTADYRPSASMTLAPTPTTIGGLSGVTEYVQGKSYVNATFSATPKESASMKRYTVGINGSQVGVDSKDESKTVKSVLLTGSGKVPVIGYAKDSRDLYTEISKEISVTPYGNPYISSNPTYGIKCFRCDSNGNASDEGAYLKYQFKVTWYSLASDKNALVCKVRIQGLDEDSGSKPITGTAAGGGSANGYKRWYNFNGTFKDFTMNATKSYKVTFSFTDTIGSSAAPLEFSIPSASVDLHLGGNKAAFGEYAQNSQTVSVSPDWIFKPKGKVQGKEIGLGLHDLIPKNADANQYIEFGIYAIADNSTAKTISNIPIPQAGTLKVYSANGGSGWSGPYIYIGQIYTPIDQSCVYRRNVYTNGVAGEWNYGPWRKYQPLDSDFIVSHYTTEIEATGTRGSSQWDIMKWNTGMVELHARVKFTDVDVSGVWDCMCSGTITGSDIPYPVTFNGVPMCIVTPEFNSGGNYWLSTCDCGGTTTKTPLFQAVRPNSVVLRPTLNYCVKGYV